MAPVLSMTGIDKRFGPVTALDGVDFELERGEIHALLGVNGAGKSTLIKILSGIYTPDAGTIEIDGAEVTIRKPRDAIDHGIASVQQHPELVGDFAGYENVFLGQETDRRSLFAPIDRSKMRNLAEDLLQRLPVDIDLTKPVEDMPSVEREIIAVLHSLKQEGIKVLILDEPTSTLTTREKAQLFEMMKILKQNGVAIIYITHRLEEVFEIADRFTVFRGGKRITTTTPLQAESDGGAHAISSMMLSREMGDLFPVKTGPSDQPPILSVRNLQRTGSYTNVSLDVRPGEVVGLFGLVGSGIEDLAKTLFGALQPQSGEIEFKGKPVALRSPQQALKQGIYLVPGDRRTEGLVMGDNIIFNTTLAALDRASYRTGFKRFWSNRRETRDLAERVDLQPPTLDRPASAFSGGNQQKVVIAKGLFRQADLYIFLEPTIGVDVGARARLYALIRELSATAGVLVLSSDCNEVCGLADRAGAMHREALCIPPSETNSAQAVLSAGLIGDVAA